MTRAHVTVRPASDGVVSLPPDDGIVLTGVGEPIVGHIADIDRIGEQLVEMPAGEGLSASLLSVGSYAPLGDEPETTRFFEERFHRPEF